MDARDGMFEIMPKQTDALQKSLAPLRLVHHRAFVDIHKTTIKNNEERALSTPNVVKLAPLKSVSDKTVDRPEFKATCECTVTCGIAEVSRAQSLKKHSSNDPYRLISYSPRNGGKHDQIVELLEKRYGNERAANTVNRKRSANLKYMTDIFIRAAVHNNVFVKGPIKRNSNAPHAQKIQLSWMIPDVGGETSFYTPLFTITDEGSSEYSNKLCKIE